MPFRSVRSGALIVRSSTSLSSGGISVENSAPRRVMSSAITSTTKPPIHEPRWIHSSRIRLRLIGLNP